MLNKQSLFKLVKGVLKSRCTRAFEPFQDSFDHHLKQTLNLLRQVPPCGECKKDAAAVQIDPLSETSYFNHDEKTNVDLLDVGKSSNAGIDYMKPFEVVMSYQLLELQCSLEKKIEIANPRYDRLRRRLAALLHISTSNMKEFSFVKIALMLNALSNIVKRMDPDTVLRQLNIDTNAKNYDDIYLLSSCPVDCSVQWTYKGNVEDGILLPSLECFDSVVTCRILYALCIYDGSLLYSETSNDRIGIVDAHSICMVLKYYATMQSITPEVIYCMRYWLKQQSSIHWRDKVAMAVYISLLRNGTLLQPYGVDEITSIAKVMRSTLGEDNILPCKIVPNQVSWTSGIINAQQSKSALTVIDMFLDELLKKRSNGSTNISMLRQYATAIKILNVKGAKEEIIYRAMLDAMYGARYLFTSRAPNTKRNKEYRLFMTDIKTCIGIVDQELDDDDDDDDDDESVVSDFHSTLAAVANYLETYEPSNKNSVSNL